MFHELECSQRWLLPLQDFSEFHSFLQQRYPPPFLCQMGVWYTGSTPMGYWKCRAWNFVAKVLASCTCQYPVLASSTEKCWAPAVFAATSSTVCVGYGPLKIGLFRLVGSRHIHIFSGFLTIVMELTHGVGWGTITPIWGTITPILPYVLVHVSHHFLSHEGWVYDWVYVGVNVNFSVYFYRP